MLLLNVLILAAENRNICLSLSWCQNINKMAKTYIQSPLSKIQHKLSMSHWAAQEESLYTLSQGYSMSCLLFSSRSHRSSWNCSICCWWATAESRLILTSDASLPNYDRSCFAEMKTSKKKSPISSYAGPPIKEDLHSSHTVTLLYFKY